MKFFKKYHKWVGLVLAFFITMSALSGIVMNHRKVISTIDIPRCILPKDFRYDSWNNASVKGSIKLSSDSILLYGGAGIWLTDSTQSQFVDFSSGFKKGADNRIVSRIVKNSHGNTFAASTFDLYTLSENSRWSNITELLDIDERITDVELHNDTLVVLSRSYLYYSLYPFISFSKVELCQPAGYQPETSAFRMLWLLHSGELFGLPGKLFVDLLGILLIILSVTGVLYFFCPRIIRRKKKKNKPAKSAVNVMKKSLKWHNKIGVVFLIFFIILTISGMFLRPPLLIPIVRSKVSNIPGTILNNSNPWFDKLRTIRYNANGSGWLMYTSSGFYSLSDFDSTPEAVEGTPPVSVMGVTVLEPTAEGWLVGSFSGLYYWNTKHGMIFDCYTGKPAQGRSRGRPVATNPISGYSGDFEGKVIFEYGKGARVFDSTKEFASMPEHIRNGRISLWHLALEVHTGRIYTIIGQGTDFFIFFFGLLTLVVLISGYLVYRKRKKHKTVKP